IEARRMTRETTIFDDPDARGWTLVAAPLPLAEQRRGPVPAEIRLAAAVLDDAVSCLSSPYAKRFREACQWLLDDRQDWPFSFLNVCEVLDLDASAVRQRLRSVIERRQPHADTLAVVAVASTRQSVGRVPTRSRNQGWRAGRPRQ